MEKKKQNQLERNREIIRNIKLAFKNANAREALKTKSQPENEWQIKKK